MAPAESSSSSAGLPALEALRRASKAAPSQRSAEQAALRDAVQLNAEVAKALPLARLARPARDGAAMCLAQLSPREATEARVRRPGRPAPPRFMFACFLCPPGELW